MKRILCPPCDISREKRIAFVLDQFKQWLQTPQLQQLIAVFNNGQKLPKTESVIEEIRVTQAFAAEHWDYRAKNSADEKNEKARWELKDDEFVVKHKDLICETAIELGLVKGNDASSLSKIDYILALGGARLSNLRRPELAKKIADSYGKSTQIIALSGMRPISDSERELIDSYAKGARYEFDAISKAMETVFNLDDYEEKRFSCDNPNLEHVIRKYDVKYNGCEVFSVAAPSTVPERRANSSDCFEFFLREFNVTEGSHIVSCTSPIYTSFQQVKALTTLAIDKNLLIDTVGFSYDWEESLKTAIYSTFLQELKSTLDAMVMFTDKYCN